MVLFIQQQIRLQGRYVEVEDYLELQQDCR
jgi:hypothetical protein